jgi:hypothetical protein
LSPDLLVECANRRLEHGTMRRLACERQVRHRSGSSQLEWRTPRLPASLFG